MSYGCPLSLLVEYLGLAYRLCWLLSLLPHPTRLQGQGLNVLFDCDRAHSTFQIFYFIRPTPANLAAYERWSGTELQYQSWLGDMVDEVYKVVLQEGNTMIIPSGWIHAVVRSTGIPCRTVLIRD